jgi:integrase
MTKHDTARLISESVTEVSQKQPVTLSSASKFSPAYWRERIYRRSYIHDGETIEVAEYRAKIQHGGKRGEVSLNSNDREAAARTAAKLYTRVKAAGWTVALAEFAPGKETAKGVPTVGDVIKEASKSADIAAITLRGYCISFRKLAADAYGVRATASRFDYRAGGLDAWRKRVDSIRLDKLTPKRIQTALDRQIEAAKGNPLAERSARVTAHAKLQKAKSLFSPDRKLPFQNLPNPFAGVAVKVGTPSKYVSTVKAGEIMLAAKSELAESQPEAYKAFLLALGAGLRAAEIDNLTWQQINVKESTVRVATTATFETKTESSEREVFVDAGLIAELETFRPAEKSDYVLKSERQPKPGAAVASYRAEITFDRLKKWLRAHGVTAQKPIHTLRKEFGSLITESSDIFTASRQLGHASIALTATYYAENRRRVAPAIGAMLNPQPEPKAVK